MHYADIIRNNRSLLDKYEVKELWLFGSAARGESSPGDIDILVQFQNEPLLLQFINLKYELESILEKPVDLMSQGACPDRFYKRIKGDLLRVA